MKSEKSVGCVIFRKENNQRLYLLLEYKRMNDEKGLHKYWDFVKGHVEKEEKEEETLLREIKEETNIAKLEIIRGFKEKLKYLFKKDNELISKEVIYFLVKTEEKEVKISFEHTDFKWLAYEEALKNINFKSSKDILKKAEKFLSNSLFKYSNI